MTQIELKKLIIYNPESGIIKWVKPKNPKSNKPLDVPNGYIEKNGYIRIRIKGKAYMAHRLAWLYMKGKFPEHQIDHINGVRDDNRFINLREATMQQNNFNRFAKGYVFDKKNKKYQARIMLSGKLIHLGLFQTTEEAHTAYLEAKVKYHGKDYSSRAIQCNSSISEKVEIVKEGYV
jgi:hypothetical protein